MLHLLRVAGYARQYKRQLLLVYISIIGVTVLQLAIPRFLGETIDTALGAGSGTQLVILAGLVLLISLLRGAFAYGQNYLAEAISQRVSYQLRRRFLDRLEHLSFAFHDRQKTGDLMSRGTYDVESIRFFVQGGLIRLPQLFLLILGVVVLLLVINWRLGLISLAVIPPSLFIAITVSKRLRKIWMNIQTETGRLTTVLQENLSGMRVVKAFGAEEHQKARFSEVAYNVSEETFRANRLFASRAAILQFLFTGITATILWFGGRQVIGQSLTAGELVQFVFYLGMLIMPMRMMGFMLNSFARAIPSAERLFQVLDAHSPVEEKPGAPALDGVRGNVRFENVSFNYLLTVPALQGVSFEAKPGQKIALLGPPGSGKSTIAQLIPRFYDVTEGRITVDGVDIRDVTLASLHKTVGIVFQDIFLFSATIRDNIAYGASKATDEQVVAAAKAAQLHDYIASQPQGYNTWVGERGVSLSGGQRQRMAIARTLLLDPPILVLDDSTSSVDAGTEHLIQKALQEVMKNRTTFIIAHRIGSVKSANLILVLDDGRIAEQGTHEELLAHGGMYDEIYQLQLLPQEEAQLGTPVGGEGKSSKAGLS